MLSSQKCDVTNHGFELEQNALMCICYFCLSDDNNH